MSRKFRLADIAGYEALTTSFFNSHAGMLARYAKGSNNVEDKIKDLRNLYPIHPATANLATYYARVVGCLLYTSVPRNQNPLCCNKLSHNRSCRDAYKPPSVLLHNY